MTLNLRPEKGIETDHVCMGAGGGGRVLEGEEDRRGSCAWPGGGGGVQ